MQIRLGTFLMAGVLTSLLAGCVATDAPATRRVEASGTETRQDANGTLVAGQAQSINAEQDLVGFWILADNADRDCLVELKFDQPGDASQRLAVPTPKCVSGMRNVAGWALVDGKIALFDKENSQIGLFEAATRYRYQGDFTISTGVSYPATFVRGA